MSQTDPLMPLTQLDIYLSNNCGLACHHCQAVPQNGSSIPSNGKKRYLALEQIFQAVHEALPLGLRTVQLSGGEPFLYPEFDALLDRLESLELGVIIETGGAGLTGARAARLAHLPQYKVVIGLDGAGPATHDTLHHVPGAFDIASQAVRRLHEAGLAPRITFTLTRQNVWQIAAVIRLAELLGAESIHFTSTQPERPIPASHGQNGKNGRQPAALRTNILAVEELAVEELIALGRKLERDLASTTRLHLTLDQPPAFRNLHPLARVEGQGRCAIRNNLSLLSGGQYALCGIGESIPELIFGQVGVDALEKIWQDHPVLVTLRDDLPGRLEGVCGRCIMKTACLGYCAAGNYLRSGAFWGPNWFCQAADRAGLFPAGRLIENRW